MMSAREKGKEGCGALLGRCGETEPRERSWTGAEERQAAQKLGRRLGQQAEIEGRKKNSFSFFFSNFPNQF